LKSTTILYEDAGEVEDAGEEEDEDEGYKIAMAKLWQCYGNAIVMLY
jgi:hypothetical protein